MNKYYLQVVGENNNTASLKAKIDIEKILNGEGYTPLYNNWSKLNKINFLAAVIKIVFQKEAIIIMQYPFVTKKQLTLLRVVKKFSNIKLISIIHDINSLRNMSDEKEEIIFFNTNDCVISHNNKMTQWLTKSGVKVPIIDLEIFDYLNDGVKEDIYTDINNFRNIYFAGNLDKNKSKFIYDKEIEKLDIKINLYGPNYDNTERKINNIEYRGSFSPEELSNQFGEGFGLIWDGTSTEKCDGINGEYLKYNNPHKTSLYLVSGLPVIVWENAALADFVKKYKVGFAVKSLVEIEGIINNMTLEEYQKLKNNVIVVKERLLNGKFTINAIRKCEDNFI